MQFFRVFVVVFALSGFTGCANRTATFITESPSTVSLVSWENLGAKGDVVGESPATVDIGDLDGRVVKVSAAGKEPQYWVFMDYFGTMLEARLKLQNAAAGASGAAGGLNLSLSQANQAFRVLLRSYQAMTVNDYELARELAKKLSEIVPNIAAPQILIGLSYLQEGKPKQARVAFTKAKTLDPEDKEVEKLINMTQ